MTTKVDFKRTMRQLYNPSIKDFHIVEVPAMNFLMVDGVGDPNVSTDYQQAIEALYSMAYSIKFALKSEGYDHVIPPMEGLWWMDDMNEFSRENIARWKWTMMLMQPGWVTSEAVESGRTKVIKKLNNSFPEKVRFENYSEGLAVQSLYTGAYENEAPVISAMHAYIKRSGYQTSGKHHEIYLSDVRKTSAEKLQTILRQPIRPG